MKKGIWPFFLGALFSLQLFHICNSWNAKSPVIKPTAMVSHLKPSQKLAPFLLGAFLPFCTGNFAQAIEPFALGMKTSTVPVMPPKPSPRPFAYSVEFTDPPCLLPRTKVGEESSIQRFAAANVIILGDHSATPQDTNLEVMCFPTKL